MTGAADGDALAVLADLPGVVEAAATARAEVDALLWERSLRTLGARLAAESVLRGGRDSAAVDGAEVRLAAVRSGDALDGTPMGRTVAAALAVTGAVPGQVRAWSTAPLQALAALHVVADAARGADAGARATGAGTAEEPGRPRRGPRADDPLRLGTPPPAEQVTVRLGVLARVLTAPTAAPALVVAAVAHGELMALRPFPWGSGLVARAAVRLVLAGRGVDPSLLSVPEAGILAMGRPAYVRAIRGFASGDPDGVADWIVWHCSAVGSGARQAREVLATLD